MMLSRGQQLYHISLGCFPAEAHSPEVVTSVSSEGWMTHTGMIFPNSNEGEI